MLPHGPYGLLPSILTTLAWLAALFQDSCDYAQLTGPIVEDLAVDPDRIPPYLEVGFSGYRSPVYIEEDDRWRVDFTSKCFNYDETEVQIDAIWKAAKG